VITAARGRLIGMRCAYMPSPIRYSHNTGPRAALLSPPPENGRVEHDEPTFFDSYAATNEAEFFAVVTESFFSNPKSIKHHHPKLYQVLQDFYCQDPAQKMGEAQEE